MAIMLRYNFALAHNATTLEKIIALYSYRSKLIGNVVAFYSYGSDNIMKALTCKAVTV
jgi:hypothetical protein